MGEVCDLHRNIENEQGATARELSQLTITLAILNRTLEGLEKKVLCHVDEGEKPGGHRDRLLTLETEYIQTRKELAENIALVRDIRAGIWRVGIASGIASSTIILGIKEMVMLIVKIFP